MKTLFLILLSILPFENEWDLLCQEMQKAPQYDSFRRQQIDSIVSAINMGDSSYTNYRNLLNYYASYQFDSAYRYTLQLQKVAQNQKRTCQVDAAIVLSFVYFSAGLFKEAFDAISSITDIDQMPTEVRASYYEHYARLYLDMATFVGPPVNELYMSNGIQMLDSALQYISPRDTLHYYYAMALKTMKKGDFAQSLIYYERSLTATDIPDHNKAIIYSSMGYPAEQLGYSDRALHDMMMAAIYDIRSSTKETVALRFVARMLLERGYSEEAMVCISFAKQDADFYGARHRQMEVSQILPIIEQESLRLERQHRQWIIGLLIGVLVLLLSLIVVLCYLWSQLRALRIAHHEIHAMNAQLDNLSKLKDIYIGSILTWQSDVIRESETAYTHLRSLAREHDVKALLAYIEALPRTNQRQMFMQHFDQMFLQICPHFIEQFNQLLLPEYRIYPSEGELLTTELRIFALIRLGITSNEKIAQVLDYSMNTIYAYKTKMRSRSILNNDDFYIAAAHIGFLPE